MKYFIQKIIDNGFLFGGEIGYARYIFNFLQSSKVVEAIVKQLL